MTYLRKCPVVNHIKDFFLQFGRLIWPHLISYDTFFIVFAKIYLVIHEHKRCIILISTPIDKKNLKLDFNLYCTVTVKKSWNYNNYKTGQSREEFKKKFTFSHKNILWKLKFMIFRFMFVNTYSYGLQTLFL